MAFIIVEGDSVISREMNGKGVWFGRLAGRSHGDQLELEGACIDDEGRGVVGIRARQAIYSHKLDDAGRGWFSVDFLDARRRKQGREEGGS